MATWLSPALTPPPAEEPHTQQVLRMQGWVKAGGLALCSARAIWVWQQWQGAWQKLLIFMTKTSMYAPCARKFGSSDNPPLLAVTEGPQVSIWDIRQGERGGCVHRLFGTSSGEPLYAISSSSDGLVATGGAERSIVVYDAYKWTARSRWTNCLKFEINGLFFSSADPGLIYVHGIDYEVLCGPWNRESSQGSLESTFTFRGDSRWLGVDKCLNMDVLAGWCESGTIFAGHIVEGI